MFRDWGRGRLPSEGKGHTFESCRVRQLFLYFTTRYARPNRSSSSVSFKRVSNLEKSPASADSSATDDVGQKLEQLLLRSAFAVIAGSLFDCLPDTVSLPKSRGHGHDQCAWSRGQSDTCPAPERILDRTSLLATVHIGKPYRDSNCVAERIWSRPPLSLLNSG